MADAVPNLLARDSRFGPLSTLTERIQGLDVSKLLVYLIDLVDADALPHLADQFHVMGLEGWNAALTEESRRALIQSAIELHRHKGTPWALKRALAPLGLTVDVIDQMIQRAAYAELGNLRVEGSWKLNGSKKIKPMEVYANLPQIQHWAQFIVRINLADATRAENFALVRPLVDEWKPVRSWPLFLYWLAFVLDVTARTESSAVLDKRSTGRYPWCGRVVGDAESVRWNLGRDGSLVKLPQPLGSFHLSERRGGISAWRLKGCRVSSNLAMQSHASAIAYRLPKLSEPDRRLDGSWKVGGRAQDVDSHALMASSSQIAVPQDVQIALHESLRMNYPATPAKLGGYARLSPWRRLDGRWSVGETTVPRAFGFKVRREQSVLVESTTALASVAQAYVSPEKLAMPVATKLSPVARRLDRSWQLGAENRIGRFRLDGRRLRAHKLTQCPRIGLFSIVPDLPGGEAYARSPGRRLHLDGGWRVGGPAAPEFTLNIIKESTHG